MQLLQNQSGDFEKSDYLNDELNKLIKILFQLKHGFHGTL